MKSLRGVLIVACCAATISASAATKSSSCVPANGNARVAWTVPAGESVQTVRAYFRSDAATAEHFIELRRSAGNSFVGVLPRVSTAASAIQYRIATSRADGKFATRTSGRVAVGSTCVAETPAASDVQLAKAIIVGSTIEGPAVPAGFRCEGIIGRVTAKGELKSYAACSEIAAAAAANAQSPELDIASAVTDTIDGRPAANTKGASAPALASTDGITADATRRQRKPPVVPPPPPRPRVSNPRPN